MLYRVIGVMSGSSLDGLDLAFVEFEEKGGKWTLKYKKSINCKKPKGFSQRQHCKYGRLRWKK